MVLRINNRGTATAAVGAMVGGYIALPNPYAVVVVVLGIIGLAGALYWSPLERWFASLQETRRRWLPSFAEALRQRRREAGLGEWEPAALAAQWPIMVPLPNGEPPSKWGRLAYEHLSPSARDLYDFARSVYAPAADLSSPQLEKLHEARGRLMDFLSEVGEHWLRGRPMAEWFLQTKIMESWPQLPIMLAYLELALAEARPHAGPSWRAGLWEMGNRWYASTARPSTFDTSVPPWRAGGS